MIFQCARKEKIGRESDDDDLPGSKCRQKEPLFPQQWNRIWPLVDPGETPLAPRVDWRSTRKKHNGVNLHESRQSVQCFQSIMTKHYLKQIHAKALCDIVR